MASHSPDIILHNGKILTVDAGFSIQEAIAVQGAEIQAVGKTSDILTLAGPDTTSIDLRGRVVIPGIIDSHAHMDFAGGFYHFRPEGVRRDYPSLEGARSIADILEVVRTAVAGKAPGEWVVTMPIGDPPFYLDVPQLLAEKRPPNRWEIDRVSPDNPVYIRGMFPTWNVPPAIAVANSRALELAGIDRNTQPPHPSITIDRDDRGEPTGVFIDNNRYATLEFSLFKVVPRFTHAQRVEALKESMGLFNSVGTTGTYEGHGIAPEVLRVYKEVWDAGEMTVRCCLVISPTWKSVADAEADMERWSHAASGRGFGDDMLWLAGYYIQLRRHRHVAGIRSAELPYTGWVGFAETYNSGPRFRQLVRLAARYGLRVSTLSDALEDPLEEILDAYEDVDREFPLAGCRWALGHLRRTTPERLRRIKRLGLVASTVPLTDFWLRGGAYLEDPQKADYLAPFRRLLEYGIPFGLETDNKPYNPFASLWAAVSRKERTSGEVIGPAQCLTRQEALRAFTLGGAYVCFDEDRRGSLETGKLADLAVLSDDLLTMPEDDLPQLHSLLTMLGGKIVHQAVDF